MSDGYNPGAYGGLPTLWIPTFMGYFHSQVMGYVWDLDVALSGAAKNAHKACRDHFYKLPVGMLGDSAGYCYRAGPQYTAPLGTYDGNTITWDQTWAAVYARMVAAGQIQSGLSCSAGGTIVSGHFPEATSYGANLQPAIAYAVDHGAPGAAAAYARYSGASNYSTFVASQGNATQWAIVPR
jgi:hypothetical protein